MNRIAALLLTVLALLAPAGALRGDSTIWVNSTADTVAVDNVVTLREALLHARRGGIFDDGSVGISCMTEAEWYQMFGDIENCVRIASPTLAGCVHNPVTDGVRYAFMNDCFYNQSGPGMGLNFADVIRFDPAISAIAIPGDFWVFRRDRLDGSRPAAPPVALVAAGAPAGAAGIVVQQGGYITGYEPLQVVVENLEVSGFPGDCLRALAPAESTFRNLSLHHCGGNGLALLPDTAHNRNPSKNQVGGGVGEGNELRDNGQFGLRIESNPAYGLGALLHVVEGNRIGWSGGDPGGAHGNAWGGAALANARGNRLGSVEAAKVNRIAGNTGAGVLLWGPEARENEVIGNLIGTIDPAGTWLAKGNGGGIVVEAGAHGNVLGGNTTSRRNVIAGNNGHGIRLWNEGDFNTIQGNRIGLDPSGAAMGNAGDGIRIEGPASQNQVVGNLVSANTGVGVHITGAGADSNTVDLNVIGLDTSQSLDRGNSSHGVQVDSGAKNNKIGSGAGQGNHIAGNDNDGIQIQGAGTDGNQVFANLVGLDFNRFNAVPNSWGGVTILFGAKNNTIGAVGAGNTLSGNGVVGVYLFGSGTSQNTIRGNWIGLSAGDGAIGNAQGGIRILSDADLNTVDTNVVSGNGGPGIEVLGPGLAGGPITNNLVGRDAADLVDRPNFGAGIALSGGVLGAEITGNTVRANFGAGIYLGGATTSGTLVQSNTITGQAGDGIALDGASGNVIGNLSPLQPNDIRQNGGFAVHVISGSGNPIRGNLLRESSHAISLGAGLPPNDPFDTDGGPNLQQNFPIPANLFVGTNHWELRWGLMSAANTSYAVDFYVGECDARGRGLPQQRLGSVTVVTDARGLYRGTDFFLGVPPIGPHVFLAATDLSANSSELSPCLPFADTDRILVDGFESGYLDGWSDWAGAAP